MKLLLTILLALPMIAQAETIGTMPNASGGRIVLTDATEGACINGFYKVMSFARNGVVIDGCWTFKDAGGPVIVIVWSDGTRSMFDAGDFTRTAEAVAKYDL